MSSINKCNVRGQSVIDSILKAFGMSSSPRDLYNVHLPHLFLLYLLGRVGVPVGPVAQPIVGPGVASVMPRLP